MSDGVDVRAGKVGGHAGAKRAGDVRELDLEYGLMYNVTLDVE